MATSKPVIITCAITGAETTKEKQPALPITPKEQAAASKEAADAGASVIHLHVREDDGKPSQRVERFQEAIVAIREAVPGMVIQISTGGAVGETIEKRLQPLSLKPEMASLNMGTMNFGDDVFVNHPKDILAFAGEMKRQNIIPELEIYETGMLEAAIRLCSQGVLTGPYHFQFVLGVPGGMSGDLSNLLHLVSIAKLSGLDFSWGVAGVGRFQLPLAMHAILLGGHVRVGFEDNIFYQKGVVAKSNAELVARVVRVAKEVNREVASIQATREILGLK